MLGRGPHNDMSKEQTLSICKGMTKEFVLANYDDVFKGFGEMPGEYNIILNDAVAPVIHAPRKIPYALHSRLENTLQKTLCTGFRNVHTEDSNTLLNNAICLLEESSEVYNEDEKREIFEEMLGKMFATMTDKASVNNLFNEKITCI